MGYGLASTRNVPKGHTVAYFRGELLSRTSAEFQKRVRNGDVFYMLWVGSEFVIDCKPNLKTCKASRCNSWKNAASFDAKNNKWIRAEQNCKLVVDTENKIVRIRSIKTIPRFTELFIEYGKQYFFDSPFELDN